MELARCHVLISGRVQGVFFRLETANIARKKNITGLVRNLRDGRVEAVFEGKRQDIDRLIRFCRRGPPSAIIKNLEIKWEPWRGEFQEFRIA